MTVNHFVREKRGELEICVSQKTGHPFFAVLINEDMQAITSYRGQAEASQTSHRGDLVRYLLPGSESALRGECACVSGQGGLGTYEKLR